MAIPVLNAGYFAQAAAARRAAQENEKDRKQRDKEQLRGFGMDLGKTLLTQTPFAIAGAVNDAGQLDLGNRQLDLGNRQQSAREVLAGLTPHDASKYWSPGHAERGKPLGYNDSEGLEDELRDQRQQKAKDTYAALGSLGEALKSPEVQATPVGRLLPKTSEAAPAAAGGPVPERAGQAGSVSTYERARTRRPGSSEEMPPDYGGGGYLDAARRAQMQQFADLALTRAQAQNLRKTEEEILAAVALTQAQADAARAKGDKDAADALDKRAAAQLKEAEAFHYVTKANDLSKRRGLGDRGVLDKPGLDDPLRFRIGAMPVPSGSGGARPLNVEGDPEASLPRYTRTKEGAYQRDPRAARVPVQAMLAGNFDPRVIGLRGPQVAEFNQKAAQLRAALRKGQSGDVDGFVGWVRDTAMGNHPDLATALADVGDVAPTRVQVDRTAAQQRQLAQDERGAEARDVAEFERAAKQVQDQVAALMQQRDRLGEKWTPEQQAKLDSSVATLAEYGLPLPSMRRNPLGSVSAAKKELEQAKRDLGGLRAPSIWSKPEDAARYNQQRERLSKRIADLEAQLGR